MQSAFSAAVRLAACLALLIAPATAGGFPIEGDVFVRPIIVQPTGSASLSPEEIDEIIGDDFQAANVIYSQIGIRVRKKDPKVLQMDSLDPDGDNSLWTLLQVRNTLSVLGPQLVPDPGTLNAYYVGGLAGFGKRVDAYSLTEQQTPGPPALAIALDKVRPLDTFAHELGHVLLNDALFLERDAEILRFPDGSPSNQRNFFHSNEPNELMAGLGDVAPPTTIGEAAPLGTKAIIPSKIMVVSDPSSGESEYIPQVRAMYERSTLVQNIRRDEFEFKFDGIDAWFNDPDGGGELFAGENSNWPHLERKPWQRGRWGEVVSGPLTYLPVAERRAGAPIVVNRFTLDAVARVVSPGQAGEEPWVEFDVWFQTEEEMLNGTAIAEQSFGPTYLGTPLGRPIIGFALKIEGPELWGPDTETHISWQDLGPKGKVESFFRADVFDVITDLTELTAVPLPAFYGPPRPNWRQSATDSPSNGFSYFMLGYEEYGRAPPNVDGKHGLHMRFRAHVAAVVPEPSSLVMLAPCLAGLLVYGLRRRRGGATRTARAALGDRAGGLA